MKYFELFSYPISFDIDLNAINARYLELQKVVHPDKFAHESSQQQLLAVQKTAELNDAFETLKHPLKRAEYMLSEQGIELKSEQQTLQDPMFLMQQMELREALEEITASDDPDAAIDDFDASIKLLRNDFFDQLKPILLSTEKAQLEAAADIVRKLKFVYKLQQELERVEDALFDD